MSDIRAELRLVALGLDAEAFVQSEMGKAFIEVLQERAARAMDELKAMRPSQFSSLEHFALRVQELQNEIDKAESFELWLVEVIETGRNLEENLKQQEASERP